MSNKDGSRAASTSKMECFVTKHSILDVAAALDSPLSNVERIKKWHLQSIVFFLGMYLNETCYNADRVTVSKVLLYLDNSISIK